MPRSSLHKQVAPGPARNQAESPDLSGLTCLVGFMVRIVQLRVFQKYYENSALIRDLTPGALSVLIAIRDNPGIRHGVLADLLVVRRPNMTKSIDSLTRSGLIERRASAADGRSIALFITPKGRRLLDRVTDLSLAHDENTTKVLTKAERAELLRLLRKTADGLIGERGWRYEG
jgi:DNA-binding MarR family transcriptional regulator